MTNKARVRVNAMVAPRAIDAAAHQNLRNAALSIHKFWDNPGDHKPLLAQFKLDIKDYYYWGQFRRCCYCSSLLSASQATWDAEHILDKSGYPEFMMELNNLAAACRPCNTGKGVRSALTVSTSKPTTIPNKSEAYKIVHPHLDDWGKYLEFDKFGRVRAKAGEVKGVNTIELCRIEAINAATLSDYFSPGTNKQAKEALFKFFTLKSTGVRKKYLALLDQLAIDYNMSEAKSIVERLRQELEHT